MNMCLNLLLTVRIGVNPINHLKLVDSVCLLAIMHNLSDVQYDEQINKGYIYIGA